MYLVVAQTPFILYHLPSECISRLDGPSGHSAAEYEQMHLIMSFRRSCLYIHCVLEPYFFTKSYLQSKILFSQPHSIKPHLVSFGFR